MFAAHCVVAALFRSQAAIFYSTVTDFARLRG